jgi:hypothetical protein
MSAFLLIFGLLASEPQQLPQPAKEKPKLICREGEQELGTHMHTSRRCKTAEEWQQEDARQRQIPVTLRVTEGQPDGTQRSQRPPL